MADTWSREIGRNTIGHVKYPVRSSEKTGKVSGIKISESDLFIDTEGRFFGGEEGAATGK